MPEFTTPAAVRKYLVLPDPDTDPTNGQYADALINGHIDTSEELLASKTGRQFAAQTAATKTFRVRGRYVRIPDLRSASAVTYNGRPLTAETDYWLVEDSMHPGIYVAIVLAFHVSRLNVPLLLSVIGDWGHDPAPPGLVTADTILAAWLTKSPDAVLGGVIQVGEGAFVDISKLPAPVYNFIVNWDRNAVAG